MHMFTNCTRKMSVSPIRWNLKLERFFPLLINQRFRVSGIKPKITSKRNLQSVKSNLKSNALILNFRTWFASEYTIHATCWFQCSQKQLIYIPVFSGFANNLETISSLGEKIVSTNKVLFVFDNWQITKLFTRKESFFCETDTRLTRNKKTKRNTVCSEINGTPNSICEHACAAHAHAHAHTHMHTRARANTL